MIVLTMRSYIRVLVRDADVLEEGDVDVGRTRKFVTCDGFGSFLEEDT